jgi:D-alanine-D-alanine ligase
MDNDNKVQTSGKNGYDLPKKLVILHSDVKREYFPTEESYMSEKDAIRYAQVIATYIQKLDIEPKLLPGNSSLVETLKDYKPDMVLNLVDTYKGSDYLASTIPAVLDLLEIPYIGTDALGLALSTNKFLVSRLLESNGVPVAHSQLFRNSTEFLDPTLRFPLFSKLNETHGSIEITKDSVSENEKHLRERLKYLTTTYKQPVLVEEFIVGREVTAGLLEGLNKKVYVGERVFDQNDEKYQFVSFDMKWADPDHTVGMEYQKYDDPILREYVKKAFAVLGMYDYGRFDIRIDSSGRYFFLDSNPNPFLGPKEIDSSMGILLDLHGVTFEEAILRLIVNTIRDTQGKERLPFPQSTP